jgi:hypothetical protein
MIPKIILDENINSKQLRVALRKKGYVVLFLGNGILDMDIKRFMIANEDTVLITADKELDLYFGDDRSFLVEPYVKPITLLPLICHYMWKFKQ